LQALVLLSRGRIHRWTAERRHEKNQASYETSVVKDQALKRRLCDNSADSVSFVPARRE
jgi:hypothetical protein